MVIVVAVAEKKPAHFVEYLAIVPIDAAELVIQVAHEFDLGVARSGLRDGIGELFCDSLWLLPPLRPKFSLRRLELRLEFGPSP